MEHDQSAVLAAGRNQSSHSAFLSFTPGCRAARIAQPRRSRYHADEEAGVFHWYPCVPNKQLKRTFPEWFRPAHISLFSFRTCLRFLGFPSYCAVLPEQISHRYSTASEAYTRATSPAACAADDAGTIRGIAGLDWVADWKCRYNYSDANELIALGQSEQYQLGKDAREAFPEIFGHPYTTKAYAFSQTQISRAGLRYDDRSRIVCARAP